MKIRYISDEEVTFDLDLREVELLTSVVIDANNRWNSGKGDSELTRLVHQFQALEVLIRAHTEGVPE